MASTEFIKALRSADSEKLVETAYHNQLRKSITDIGGLVQDLKTLHGTDGVLDGELFFDGTPKVFRIIIETKLSETFNIASVRAKVLSQVVYYLKKFDELGEQLPNIILVGDVNECFVVHSNYLSNYLDRNYDWNIAPSQVYRKNIELVKELTEDTELQKECFVYEINDTFEFDDIMVKIEALIQGVKTQVRITEKSISKVFDYFSMRVLKRSASGESKYTAREQVEYFMQLVLHEEDCYLHVKKKNKAVLKGVEVDVDGNAFESFMNHYKFKYNALEKKAFTSIADRLIEDSDRRRKGDFYTPAIWVDEAHKKVAENLGPKWKEEYMVWDCAWGTGNLTRDYRFFDLYCSTLEEHDLKIGAKYNQEAEAKFQYDFLNDDVEEFEEIVEQLKTGVKLDEKLFYQTKLWKQAPSLIRGLISGKPLLFLINPPYGTGGNLGLKDGKENKTGIAKTKINLLMTQGRESIGSSAQQLYAQFLFRVSKLYSEFGFNIKLAMFSPPLYITGQSFSKLRESLNLRYLDGMVFQASEFADVASNWGITFILFEATKEDFPSEITVSIKTTKDGIVTDIGEKMLYSVEKGKLGSDWIKEDLKGLKPLDSPQMKSALNYSQKRNRGTMLEGSFGYYFNNSNMVEKNSTLVFLLTSCAGAGNGNSVTDKNYFKIISNFAARKLISGEYSTWVNSKDEYMIPNIKHPLYSQWEEDCVVLSIFNVSSNQSSLRQIDYEGRNWDILNHFFFMSKQDMEDLALGEHPNDEVYEDLQNHAEDERFVYKKLQEVTLSPDAQAVLDKARQLVKDSFQYRDLFNQEHPEYHINTWDAGWYQIKGLLKEYMPEELKEFNKLYKQFEDRMRPLVVELGFLYDYPGYEEDREKYLGNVNSEHPKELENIEV